MKDMKNTPSFPQVTWPFPPGHVTILTSRVALPTGACDHSHKLCDHSHQLMWPLPLYFPAQRNSLSTSVNIFVLDCPRDSPTFMCVEFKQFQVTGFSRKERRRRRCWWMFITWLCKEAVNLHVLCKQRVLKIWSVGWTRLNWFLSDVYLLSWQSQALLDEPINIVTHSRKHSQVCVCVCQLNPGWSYLAELRLPSQLQTSQSSLMYTAR